jgi:ankyrin repeat protein
MDLREAANQGSTIAVRDLLEKGADINVKDNYDSTPIMCASTTGRLEILKNYL